ncbi:hypothetical protein F5Y16DRAFT_27638 [Xylariaceae sp. FL0255]|nr:hypothetical protein F5Y16DRAFT_27638 [Xylariaceae sp. FL0255]
MSSSNSSSSLNSQRVPLQERSEAEKNKLQIRLVPYSPPRLEAGEGSSPAADESGIQGSTSGASRGRTQNSSSYTPTLQRKASSPALSSAYSPTTPSPSWARAGTRSVSATRWGPDPAGGARVTPPTPAMLRAGAYGSNIRRVNAFTQPLETQDDDEPGPSPLRSRPSSRIGRVINVHSDKTFSLSLKPVKPRVSTGSESTASQSYLYSNTSGLTSHEETSFDAPSNYRPSSLFSALPERSVSPSVPGTPASPSALSEDLIPSSPWNYQLAGGLRKVPITPDVIDKGKGKEIASSSPLSPLPELIQRPSAPEPPSSLATKPSFTASDYSDSILEQTANYDVVGRSSPALPYSDASSNDSNYQLIGQSSPPQPLDSSPTRPHAVLDTPGSQNYIVHDNSPYPATDQSFLDTPGSKNFIVHHNVSASPSVNPFIRQPRAQASNDSFSSFGSGLNEKYSQESLVIPPLRPQRLHKRSSSEQLYRKQISGQHSHHGRSSSFSSISSILTQDSGPNVVRLAHTPSDQSLRQPTWAGRSNVGSHRSRMDTHQWSTQLSTVMSEYEGSDRGSRLTSLGSLRASSGLGSRGSRQIQSLSSSILETLDQSGSFSRSHSRTDSFDRPSPVLLRGTRDHSSPPLVTVRDHDEDGDGLADLQQHHPLQTKNSRTRLGFLSRQASDRSLRSNSSRASSFTFNSLPTWARLYYGSGDRAWLGTPSIISEGDDGSRPPSAWAPSGSMTPDQVEQSIRNPRRRPHEVPATEGQRPLSMEITPVTIGEIRRGPKKMTSSIWSPHLRRDNRSSRYSMWEPPSTTWSVENRIFGRRNIQLVLFTLGFVFPFAWMIAAFLPLPPDPQLEMEEKGQNTSRFTIPEEAVPEPFYQQFTEVDDSRYQSARWWRNLNRLMSILGLLILGAVIALAVLGARGNW